MIACLFEKDHVIVSPVRRILFVFSLYHFSFNYGTIHLTSDTSEFCAMKPEGSGSALVSNRELSLFSVILKKYQESVRHRY